MPMVSHHRSCPNKSSKGVRVQRNKVYTVKDYKAILAVPPLGSKASSSAAQPLPRARTSLINPAQAALSRLEPRVVGPMVLRKKRVLVSRPARIQEVRAPKDRPEPVMPFPDSKASNSHTSTSRATSVAYMGSNSPNNLDVPMASLIRLNTISNTAPAQAIGNELTPLHTLFFIRIICRLSLYSLLHLSCFLFISQFAPRRLFHDSCVKHFL